MQQTRRGYFLSLLKPALTFRASEVSYLQHYLIEHVIIVCNKIYGRL